MTKTRKPGALFLFIFIILMACSQSKNDRSPLEIPNPNVLDLKIPTSNTGLSLDTLFLYNDSLIWKGKTLNFNNLELELQKLKKETAANAFALSPAIDTKIHRVVAIMDIARRNDIDLVIVQEGKQDNDEMSN